MSMPLFRGTGTALSTPFNADGSIDFGSFGTLIDTQLANGVEALIPCGSTGESATMTHDEKLEVIRFTIERARVHDGQRPVVVAGTGSNVTAATIELTREARELGADGVLLVSPYYNKPSQRGIIEHFSAIATAVPDLPIVLYNVPARTASNMTAQTTIELARRHENIVAIKEASADMDQCSSIIRDAPGHFVLYSGEDSLTLPLLALGAQGVIAVVSNEVPEMFGSMVRLALAGDFSAARALHMKLFALMKLNFIETNPVPVKEALHMMGLFQSATFRAPLVPLEEGNRAQLRAGLAELGLV
ncbi:MAG: 4-hydroxy-tetrahydrodipicolinate synthase [Bacteroidetes bacterium]|nr:4-hydroxy-tetrahydrodipicolinate synthase [Bacteroidota bacterium]